MVGSAASHHGRSETKSAGVTSPEEPGFSPAGTDVQVEGQVDRSSIGPEPGVVSVASQGNGPGGATTGGDAGAAEDC